MGVRDVARSILDNTIVEGLDHLYNAHALISSLANNNPDWAHIRDQLYSFLVSVEEAQKVVTGIGGRRRIIGREPMLGLIDAARRGDLARASTIADRLYDAGRILRAINSLAWRQICPIRILSVASLLIALFGLLGEASLWLAMLGVTLVGLGVSSVFSCFNQSGRSALVAASLGFLLVEMYQLLSGSVAWPTYTASIVAWLIVLAGHIEEVSILGLYERFGRIIADTSSGINTSIDDYTSRDLERGEDRDGEEVRRPDIHPGGGP